MAAGSLPDEKDGVGMLAGVAVEDCRVAVVGMVDRDCGMPEEFVREVVYWRAEEVLEAYAD